MKRPAFWRDRQRARRISWTFGDQMLSSLTNFLVAMLVARAVPTAEFGAFALAFSVFILAQGLSRSICSMPLGIRHSTGPERAWREKTGEATATALLLGLSGGLALAAIGTAMSEPLRSNMVALGVVMPAVLVQDTWRFAFFAAGRPASATANDSVWASLLVVLYVTLGILGTERAWVFIAAWGVAALAASLFGVVQAEVVPSIRSARRWLTSQRDLYPSLIGELAVYNGMIQGVIFGMGAIAGLEAVGAFRGGRIVFGPVNIVVMGIVAVAVPEGARLLAHSPRHLVRGMSWLSLVGAGGAMLWGLVAWSALPDHVGVELLGDTWTASHEVLPSMLLLSAVTASTTGAINGLRVLEQVRASFVIRLAIAPMMLLGGLLGAFLGGAPGAAFGLAAPMAVGSAAWWRTFLRHARRHGDQRPREGGLEGATPVTGQLAHPGIGRVVSTITTAGAPPQAPFRSDP